ncbi:MAG: DUF2314 domain-containing protein [Phycisphaerae bacterium]|nr:DUF2314 domain-containing protein [Phycisphaerae bacterium]
MPVAYTLDNGEKTHQEFPDRFEMPPQTERESLRPGDRAKLMFRIEFGDEAVVERMWVRITEVRPELYVGVLYNDPHCTEEMRGGMRVEFHADHLIQIHRVVD